jgi:hypothetical protein
VASPIEEVPYAKREDIHRSVRRGIRDIEAGRFEEYSEDGLRGLAATLVAGSVSPASSATSPTSQKKQISRTKTG